MADQTDLFPAEALRGGGLAQLRVLHDRQKICINCKLHESRTNVVFGTGNGESPDIAFLGEGPGENEDKQGVPFVGRAGDLLNKMIEAMGYQRSDIYICNVVGCRPPSNRKPEPDEVSACREFFTEQLRIIKPLTIVCLGATAAQALLKSSKKISDLRGRWFDWEGVPARATYHPAYLLRDANKKKDAWADLQVVSKRIESLKALAKETS